MIIVKLMGGLGNQMFQYAAGRHFAGLRHAALKLDTNFLLDRTPREHFMYRDYELGVFRIPAQFATPADLRKFTNAPNATGWKRCLRQKLFKYQTIREQRLYHFDERVLRGSRNTFLIGYWQNERYFKAIEPMLRREFAFKTAPTPQNQEWLERIAQCQSVSVHIRRGDYVTNPVTQAFHGTCGIEYYQQAIERIKQRVARPSLFVFSDDIAWAKNNLQTDLPTEYVTHNQGAQSYEDLRLMTTCRHFIIANSSFSWWGAWLGMFPEKIVIAPKKWVSNQTHNDAAQRYLLPASWERV